LASGALKSEGGLQYIEKIALDLESLSEKILDNAVWQGLKAVIMKRHNPANKRIRRPPLNNNNYSA